MTGASTTANENSSSSNTNNSKKQQKQQQQQQQPQKQKQRKEHPLGRRNRQRNNNQRTALANIDDVESVQLEQAVRELNCFEALSVNNANNHRTFALEYLEGILARWCRHVEEQAIARTQKENAATKQQQQQQQSSPNIPPSFAAVAAGAGKSPSSQAAAAAAPPTAPPKSFAQAVAPKPNVWQRTPASVRGATSDASKKNSAAAAPVGTSPVSSPVAALIPFGSYRLGVHSTESDLDLLALAPPHVHRSDFFTSLVKLLRDDERCQQVHPIPSAYTPVIKFVFVSCGQENKNETLQIDLVFARVSDATKLIEYQKQKVLQKEQNGDKNIGGAQQQAPVEYHLDDTDLQDLDEAGVRSLNGARVSQMLLEFVPDIAKFQTVLRAVKHWAVVHGIYSNVLGFLGGVNWAIMTAYVCKQFPNLDAASTLRIFFRTFASWQWNRPVMLFPSVADTPPITNVSKQTRAVYLPAWNPQTNPRDGLHIMPIITPAYPSMNSSYNVDMPQLRRIKEEMIRASNLLQQRHQGKQRKGSANNNIYSELFAPSDFFGQHRHFLRIDIMASSEQDFVEWFRLVESRLRLLTSNLDTPQLHAWPFAQFFKVPKSDPWAVPHAFQKCFFIGLRFSEDLDEINVQHLTMDFLHKVNSWEGRKAGMDLSMQHLLDDAVPLYVWEELRNSNKKNGTATHKDGSEQSVDSENTAPATDDEEDETSCHSVAPNGKGSPDLASPTKKCRVVVVAGTNKTNNKQASNSKLEKNR